jgi:dihydroflavonol-4-reductase
MKGTLPLLDVDLNATGEKAKRLLHCSPRSREDAIVATAESLMGLGLLPAG